jgi:hypothetical protein
VRVHHGGDFCGPVRRLEAVRKALKTLAKAYKPKELAEEAYRLYERFRPSVSEGVKGWGAKGELDLGLIHRLAKKKDRNRRGVSRKRHDGALQQGHQGKKTARA